MKKRRTIIIAFVLAAVLVMGVGYAALTDLLTVDGKANISIEDAQDQFDEHIYFSKVETPADAEDTITIDTTTFASDTVNINVKSLHAEGQTAVFTMTIKNDSALTVNVAPKIATDESEEDITTLLNISSDWNGQAQQMAAGEEKTYTLTVELLQTPTTESWQIPFRVIMNVTTVE